MTTLIEIKAKNYEMQSAIVLESFTVPDEAVDFIQVPERLEGLYHEIWVTVTGYFNHKDKALNGSINDFY